MDSEKTIEEDSYTSDDDYSYDTDNSIKKEIVKRTKTQQKKENKKNKNKKSISFEGDTPKNCRYCKKEFANPLLLRKHYKGTTNCGLKSKLDKYKKNFEKLKTLCQAEILEKDELINNLKNNSSASSNNAIGLSAAWQEKLKAKLNNISFPTTKIDGNIMKKYKLITNDANEQFSLFFKNFIDYKPNSKIKNGIFITNARKEYGLVFKCNNQLFIDTQGILMVLLRNYWDSHANTQ